MSVPQVSAYKTRVIYVGVLEIRFPHVCAFQMRTAEVGRLEMRIAEVDGMEVGAAQIQPPFFDSLAAAHLVRAAKDHGYRRRYIGRRSRQAFV
jgi:hypothetical protein